MIQRKNKGRLTRDDMNFIMSKVEEQARYRVRDVSNVHQPSGVPSLADWAAQQADMAMHRVVSDVRRELEIMIREQDAFPQVATDGGQQMPHPQVNIHNSSIANLNLGSQLGTINSALGIVSHGDAKQEDFARALKDFTEAVLGDLVLPDPQKQETVQILADIAKQAEAKPEERLSGKLKAGLAYLADADCHGSASVSSLG